MHILPFISVVWPAFEVSDEVSLCMCNRFVLQDLILLRDPRATLLWKQEGLPFPVQNSKYFAALLLCFSLVVWMLADCIFKVKKEKKRKKKKKTTTNPQWSTIRSFKFLEHFRGGVRKHAVALSSSPALWQYALGSGNHTGTGLGVTRWLHWSELSQRFPCQSSLNCSTNCICHGYLELLAYFIACSSLWWLYSQ